MRHGMIMRIGSNVGGGWDAVGRGRPDTKRGYESLELLLTDVTG